MVKRIKQETLGLRKKEIFLEPAKRREGGKRDSRERRRRKVRNAKGCQR